MIIDLAVVGLLLLFTLMGVYQGLVPQLFRTGALVTIWLFLKPLAGIFSLVLSPFGLPGLTGLYLGGLIGGVVVYAGFSFLGKYLSDRFINTRTSRMEAHSKLGGYLGFVKGALVAVLVLFILGALPQGYLAKKPGLHAQVQDSWAVSAARLINPFPELTVFDDLSAYQKLLEDPEAVARLKEQPAFQKLRDHPAVQELLNDPETADKLEQGDYRFLLADPKVVRVLKDPEARRLLRQLDPRAALTSPPPAEPRPESIEPAGRRVIEPEPQRPVGDEDEGTLQESQAGEDAPRIEGNIPVEPPTPNPMRQP